MVLNEKNKEKINDLKQLIELADNEHEKIISIFKKNASTKEAADAYIIRYLPYFIKGIDDKNALILFKKKLDIYDFYISLSDELDYVTKIKVKTFINEMKIMNEKNVINPIIRLNYKGYKDKIRFLVWVRNMLNNTQIVSENDKNIILKKVESLQKSLYEDYLKDEKNKYLKNLRNKNDVCYNFVSNLLKCDKSEWFSKIKEFLSNQKDDLIAKNKLLKIFLMSKLGSSSNDLMKLYISMDKYINPAVDYVVDPISGNLISKENYNRSYGKIKNFFDKLMTISLEEKDKIISLYSEFTKDNYYHKLVDIKEKLSKMFVALYKDIPNAKAYIDERTDIYIEYRNGLRKESYDKLKEGDRIWKEQMKDVIVQEELIRLREFFNKYIYGNYDIIEEYKNDFNIKNVELRENLNYIKEHDKDFYNIVMQKQKSGMEIIKKKIYRLLSYLNNGIGEPKREFDVIDYYLIFKTDIEVLRSIVLNMNLNDEYIMMRFLSSNIRLERLSANTLLNTFVEVNCETDKDGNLIKGTGFIIPKEIRENAVKFLEENNIPLNDVTYRTLINRYLMENNIDHQYKAIIKR